ALEKFHIFRISARPAAFDISHAKIVQTTGNLELVFNRESESFPLCPIAQCRIINLSPVLLHQFPIPKKRPIIRLDKPRITRIESAFGESELVSSRGLCR